MSQPITEMSATARIRDIAAALVHEAAIMSSSTLHSGSRLEAMAADLDAIANEISLGLESNGSSTDA